MKKFMTLCLLSLVLALTGCASLQYAGSADYSVKPFKDDKGAVLCCAVEVHNGKEIANLEAHIVKNGADYTVDLKEQGVAAFAGQAIAAGATQQAIDAAAKAAAVATLAPLAPLLIPAAGAALSSGGLGAAAVGAVGVVGAQKALAK